MRWLSNCAASFALALVVSPFAAAQQAHDLSPELAKIRAVQPKGDGHRDAVSAAQTKSIESGGESVNLLSQLVIGNNRPAACDGNGIV